MNIKKTKKINLFASVGLVVTSIFMAFNLSQCYGRGKNNDAFNTQQSLSESSSDEESEWYSQTVSSLDHFYIANGVLTGLTPLGMQQEKLVLPFCVTKIGSNVFEDAINLKQVVMFENVKELSPESFRNSGIKQIVLSENITCIPESAFENCVLLEELVLPKKLISIHRFAFKGCEALTELIIPENVTSISELAFPWYPHDDNITIINHSSVLFSWWAKHHDYNGKCLIDLENINIQDYHNSKGDSFTIIGESAFDVFAEENVENPTSKLKTIDLGNQITAIHKRAFASCANLEKFTIPSSVKLIEEEILADCGLLNNQNVKNNACILFDWWVQNYPYDGQTLSEMKEISLQKFSNSIGDGFNVIANKAFYEESVIESISIHREVSFIGESAFANCSSLRKVVFNNKCKTIPKRVLQNCKNLAEVEMVDHITTIESLAFEKSSKLTNINFPLKLKHIGEGAFRATGLEEIRLPNQLEVIDDYAFQNCQKLTRVFISEFVKKIGENVFDQCPLLTDIDNYSLVLFDWWVKNHQYDSGKLCNKRVIKKEDVYVNSSNKNFKFLGTGAFSDCEMLESFTLSNSFKSIPDFAFRNCEYLEEVKVLHPIDAIGIDAFVKCPSLKIVDAANSHVQDLFITNGQYIQPSQVTVSSYFNINGNQLVSLTKEGKRQRRLIVPSNVEIIGHGAFAYGNNLEEIILPKKLIKIDYFAFRNCCYLKKVNLPEGLKIINRGAFQLCRSLEKINIPASVEHIGEKCFMKCDALQEVENNSTILFDWWVHNHYYSDNDDPGVLAKKSIINLDHFKNSRNQLFSVISESAFGESEVTAITLSNTVTKLSNEAFRDCVKLKEIKFNNNIKEIGNHAFINCVSLDNVIMPDSIKEVGEGAFSYCSYLRKIKFSNSIVHLRNKTLYRCQSLRNVIFPSQLLSIGDEAFYKCTDLPGVITFPQSLREIGIRAFAGCIDVLAFNLPNTLIKMGKDTFGGIRHHTFHLETENVKKILLSANAHLEEVYNIRWRNKKAQS